MPSFYVVFFICTSQWASLRGWKINQFQKERDSSTVNSLPSSLAKYHYLWLHISDQFHMMYIIHIFSALLQLKVNVMHCLVKRLYLTEKKLRENGNCFVENSHNLVISLPVILILYRRIKNRPVEMHPLLNLLCLWRKFCRILL